MWNLNTGELSRTISYKSPSEVKAIAFSPNGQMLATSSYRDTLAIKFWNVRTGEEIQTIRSVVKPKINRGVGFDLSQNSQIAFSPDGKSLISITGGNPTIQVWDVGQLRAECNANKQIQSKDIKVRSPQFNTPQATTKNTL